MRRVVLIHTATQVDPSHLDEYAWLHDDQTSIDRMARLTASSCSAEGDARGEGGDEQVLEQSHGHLLASRLRDPSQNTCRAPPTLPAKAP